MNKLRELTHLLIQKLKQSMSRFPETIVTAVAFVVIAIIQNHGHTGDTPNKVLLGLVVGGILFAIQVLIRERMNLKMGIRLIADLLIILFTVIYVYRMPSAFVEAWGYRYVAFVTVLLGIFLLIPYAFRREGFSKYLIYLIGKVFLTYLYSIVLFIGLFAIGIALETLFNINIGDIYLDLFLISMIVFGVTYFLGNVPEIHYEMTLEDYPKIFKSIFLYIAIPVMVIYTVILHAYFVKLIFEGELPEGMIGSLVLWHGTISTVTLFFLRDVRSEKEWLKPVYKYYPFALVVPMGMLFLAMGIRINAYGLTVARYLGLAIGLFVVGATLMNRFKKKDSSVVVMTLLLVMLVISFFGVVSGPTLALNYQNQRFEEMLVDAGVYDISTGNFQQQQVASDEADVLKRQYRYLKETYGYEAIKVIPKEMTPEALSLATGVSFEYGSVELVDKFYMNQVATNDVVIPVEGAKWVMKIETFSELAPLAVTDHISVEKSRVVEGKPHDELIFKLDGQTAESINMAEWVKEMAQNQSDTMRDTKVIQIESQAIQVTLQVFNYSGEGEEDYPTQIDDYSAYLLIGFVND